MRSIAILAVLLLGNYLYAAKAVISGPDKVRPGQLFVLETTGSEGEAQRWIMPSAEIQSLECGAKIGMAIERPGVYTFHLIVADKVPTIDVATHTVTVGAVEPPPPPPPPPGDFAALAAKSKELAQALNDPPTAKAIATNLRSVASRNFGDLPAARMAVSVAVESALLSRQGASRDKDWLTTWRKPVATELEHLSAAGQMPTVDRYLQAVRVLATSLE